MNTFNDLEAIEIAIEIEQRGHRFYTQAQKYVENEEVAAMLEELANQELDHIETFESLYVELKNNKSSFDDTYIYDPEVVRYLRAMVSTSVFPSEEELDKFLSEIRTAEDVLSLGIKAEKDSILFYTEMVIQSHDVEAKNAFRKLIKEEKKHLIDLQEKMLQYKNQ